MLMVLAMASSSSRDVLGPADSPEVHCSHDDVVAIADGRTHGISGRQRALGPMDREVLVDRGHAVGRDLVRTMAAVLHRRCRIPQSACR